MTATCDSSYYSSTASRDSLSSAVDYYGFAAGLLRRSEQLTAGTPGAWAALLLLLWAATG
jgi:hypothetical protein